MATMQASMQANSRGCMQGRAYIGQLQRVLGQQVPIVLGVQVLHSDQRLCDLILAIWSGNGKP